MAESEHDKLAARYRTLGREEPAPELDATILDAARQAVQTRPGRRRWMLPASIAAVIVLSVGVAVQVQREQSEQADQLGASTGAGKAAKPAEPAAPAAGAPTPPPAPELKLQESAARRAAPAGRLSQQAVEASPERWLTQIAELRRLGRDDEADRQLAEFRRRFPDYRIPEAMQQKIAPR